MDLTEIEKLVQALDGQFDELLETHELRIARSLRRCEQKIINLAKRMETLPDGTIKGPHWTLSQAQDIHAQLEGVFEETFGQAWDLNVKDFDKVRKMVLDTYGKLKIPTAFNTVDKQVLSQLKEQSFQVYHTLTDQTVNRISQSVYDAVLTGQSFAWLTAQIAGALNGYTDIKGRTLKMYANVYAHDSLMDGYAALHKKKADELGMDTFLYVGNVIRDSRPFCVVRAGKKFTREEIEAWNDLDWAGKSPGDIFIRRGGYNCRHHFLAVKPDWIPEGQIDVQRWNEKPLPRKKVKPVTKREGPLTFDAINDLDDAEEWARGKFDWIRWDFTDAHINAIRPTLKEFNRLAELYPEVVKEIKYVGTYKGKLPEWVKNSIGTAPYRWQRAYAHASHDGKRIGLNPRWYGKTEQFEYALRHNVETGWSPKGCDRIESVMTHEFGHHVYNWYMRQHKLSFAPVQAVSGRGSLAYYFNWQFGPVTQFGGKVRSSYRISRYSLMNRSEAWAEGFASVYHTPPKHWVNYQKKASKFLQAARELRIYQENEWVWSNQVSADEREAAVKFWERVESLLGITAKIGG